MNTNPLLFNDKVDLKYYETGYEYGLTKDHILNGLTKMEREVKEDEYCKSLEPLGCFGYFITSKGRLFSLFSNNWISSNDKPSSSNGYLKTRIANNNFLMHILVATMFLENPYGYKVVDHINGDRTDNDVSNLRWISYSDNNKKINEFGYSKKVYTDDDIHFICKKLEENMSISDIRDKYKYPREIIYRIKTGYRHRDISKNYKFSYDTKPSSPYIEEEVRSFCIMNRDFFLNAREISELYEYPRDSIYRILMGRSWRHVTEDYFEYVNNKRFNNEFDCPSKTFLEMFIDWENDEEE